MYACFSNFYSDVPENGSSPGPAGHNAALIRSFATANASAISLDSSANKRLIDSTIWSVWAPFDG
jgi:hypothetical protein